MDRFWTPYCGAAPLPADWFGRWNLDPFLMLALAAAAIAFHRAGARAAAWAGLAILGVLFLSPLCPLSSALFSVRVAHHVAMAAIAAPLIAAGLPDLPVPGRASLWAAAHGILFGLWHAPGPYAYALSGDAPYWLMEASLLLSAIGFFATLRRAAAPTAIGLLLGLMVVMGLVGALLTFAPSPLYAPHLLTTAAWGLSPVEDQQLAGLVMWAPGSLFYLIAALLVGWRMLADPRPAALA